MSKKSALLLLKIRFSRLFISYNKTFKQFILSEQKIRDSKDPYLADHYLRAHTRAMQFASQELCGDNYSLMRKILADDQYVLFDLSVKIAGYPEHIKFFKPVTPNSA